MKTKSEKKKTVYTKRKINLVGRVWHEQQAHIAHVNKHKTIVNISLFVYFLAQPITYIGVLCLCPEQTVFQEDASQPAEDACTSNPFLLR